MVNALAAIFKSIPNLRLGQRIFRMPEEEYERACRVTLQIKGERRLLDQLPALQRPIAGRDPSEPRCSDTANYLSFF